MRELHLQDSALYRPRIRVKYAYIFADTFQKVFETISNKRQLFLVQNFFKSSTYCTGIYRDANLLRKSAYLVAAWCRINHRDAVYHLCRGHGVSIILIPCKHRISQLTRRCRLWSENGLMYGGFEIKSSINQNPP